MTESKTTKKESIESYLKSIRDELFILNKTLMRYANFKMEMAKKRCQKSKK
ncbi:MAG: hypothetical protein LBF00_02030 [Mycoplasmataceae bacterium]|nr:hypothetical protein [Mycoplasmataceae bacterium]